MKPSGRLAVVALMSCAASLASVSAQVSVDPRSGPMYSVEIPESRSVIVPPSRSRMPGLVHLTSTAASIDINDQVATTSLELTLVNPQSRPQEAELLIPVPDGVTVRSFQYDGTGPEPTAVLLARDEARRLYDSIVNRTKDPGLLEFAGQGAIRTCVFPVPAGATQKVRLVYEQLLVPEGGRFDYTLPRSDSLATGGSSWSMVANVTSARALATVYSPSHEIVTERRSPKEIKVRVTDSSAVLPGSLRLSYLYAAAPGEAPVATLMAYPDSNIPGIVGGNGGYFLLLAGLPEASPGEAAPVKREVTLVIDRSGSMSGVKIEQARTAALQVIEQLEMGEAFNIIDYSDSIASFSGAPVVKTQETIESARAYLKAIRSGGGTNIHDSLIEALRPAPQKGMLPIVLFLTDGVATSGITSEMAIREDAKGANVHNRRIFSFGVGNDVNTPLLSNLSRETRGKPTFVLPQENVETKVADVFRGMKGPVLAAPKLTAVDDEGNVVATAIRELQPGALPDLFEGDQLIVLGQYSGGSALRLKLSGDYYGQPKTFAYTFDLSTASPRQAPVARLWATRKIASLIDQVRQRGASSTASTDPAVKEFVEEIVRLSTKFGILTEYTSFLATDPNDKTAVAVPASESFKSTMANMSTRALSVRSGAGSVNQERNVNDGAAYANAPQMNAFYDEKNERQELRTVQNIASQTIMHRNGRWIDARLLSQENDAPQQTVTFGTPEYQRVVDALVKEGMQGVLTNSGDLYLLVEGQRTLIKQGA